MPAEATPLLGLAKANAELILDLLCPRPVKTATLDIERDCDRMRQRAAKRAYDGNRGYQPVLALWAEQDVIIADEFRDGNVPAGSGNRRVSKRRWRRGPAASARSICAATVRSTRTRADALARCAGDRLCDLSRYEPATRRMYFGIARGSLATRP